MNEPISNETNFSISFPADGWMNIPLGIPNCPPGLEYLTTIDQLLVKQKVELLEAIIGFETNNKFTIKNNLGQKVRDCLLRLSCSRFKSNQGSDSVEKYLPNKSKMNDKPW